MQWIKRNEKGERIRDDRHHALDAIIVAATTESLLNSATRQIQKREREGLPFELTEIFPPWTGFREACLDALEMVFVARAERRRARGKAHDATFRQVATRDGERKAYERKMVADIKIADLERIKDPDRNIATVRALRAWIEAGKPAGEPPRSPKGDPIRKIRLAAKSKVNILLNTGNPNRPAAVDRGDMARVDVFRKPSAKGVFQYFLVPIYPHDNFGGTQRQALELALNLNPARFKAEIWTMAAGDDMEPLAEKGRIPVVHLSKKTWVGPECLFNLWRRLRSAPIDILVLMTVVPNWGRLLAGLPESRSLSAPAEVTVLPSGSTKNCSGPWRTTISAMQSP